MIDKPSKPVKSGFPAGAWVGILVALFASGVAIWVSRTRETQPSQPPAITAEAKAYVKNLQLSDTELKATDSAMAKSLVEIVGNIKNNGDRKLKLIELNCVFYDPYSQVVLRERVAIVRPKTGGLPPGETKPFRMPFDNLPDSWNQAMPQLVIAQIQFE